MCIDGADARSLTPYLPPCLTISGSCRVSSFISGHNYAVAGRLDLVERVFETVIFTLDSRKFDYFLHELLLVAYLYSG